MAATSQQTTLFHDYDGFVEKFKPKKTTKDMLHAYNRWLAAEYNTAVARARTGIAGEIYKTYHHHRGCRRLLYGFRYSSTCEYTANRVFGHAAKNVAHAVAGHFLQTFDQQCHAVDEYHHDTNYFQKQ